MQIKKILFPTDFTEGSEAAAPWAADMAKKYGAKVYILHVVYDIARYSGWDLSQIDMTSVYDQMEQGVDGELKKLREKYFPDVPDVETVSMRGVPNDDVIRFAAENSIELIVMGSHGRKGLDRVLFGSTAAKVVRNAHCPVLTVRI